MDCRFLVIMQFMILSFLRSSIFLRYTVLQLRLYLAYLPRQLAQLLLQLGPQIFNCIFLCHNPAIPCPQVPGQLCFDIIFVCGCWPTATRTASPLPGQYFGLKPVAGGGNEYQGSVLRTFD
jgi:hypothetical protein